MAFNTSHSSGTSTRVSECIRGLFRVVMCLCMWSGPTPVLHAHEKTGQVIDRNPELAEHVWVCHRHDDHEQCRHWHMHFMLWGEVQPDASDSDSVPRQPPQKDLQSEFALAPSAAGTALELARSESTCGAFDLSDLIADFSNHSVEAGVLNSTLLYAYQSRVAVSHDVARLLMVVRC